MIIIKMDSEEEKLIIEEITKQEEEIAKYKKVVDMSNNHPQALFSLSKKEYNKTQYLFSYSFRYIKFKKEVIDMCCDDETTFKKLIIKPYIRTRIAYTDIPRRELNRMIKSGSDIDEIEFANIGGCIKLIKTNEQSDTYWLDKNMIVFNKKTLIGCTYLSKVLIKKIEDDDTIYTQVEKIKYDVYNEDNSDSD
jgi:hypothetical protein